MVTTSSSSSSKPLFFPLSYATPAAPICASSHNFVLSRFRPRCCGPNGTQREVRDGKLLDFYLPNPVGYSGKSTMPIQEMPRATSSLRRFVCSAGFDSRRPIWRDCLGYRFIMMLIVLLRVSRLRSRAPFKGSYKKWVHYD